jgi:hypothetical protein
MKFPPDCSSCGSLFLVLTARIAAQEQVVLGKEMSRAVPGLKITKVMMFKELPGQLGFLAI